MRKRIGTKLYDTESSEHVANVGIGHLYRKLTRDREWFLVIGDDIEPLEDPQARSLLGDTTYIEKPVDQKRIMIGVDRDTHARIAAAAKKKGCTISDLIRQLSANL